MNLQNCHYWPFYCEENIWHLSRSTGLADLVPKVVFISNPGKRCALANQRAANGGFVIWDYHVVMMTDGKIWDLDTLLPFPCLMSEYLERSFMPELDDEFRSFFRVVEADDFIGAFASDRSHMLDEQGDYLHPPPPWPAINPGRETNLHRFVDMKLPFLGRILDLAGMSSLV
ncbi:MAG: hypothetical protein GY866_23030 [Proteobacteria bacterium]|nr:hypothetical protein [Pseudomonadota bacterium]